MHTKEWLAHFLARNPGQKLLAHALWMKVAENRVVETTAIGPVIRTVTAVDAKGFAWDGPLIGNDPQKTGAGHIPFDGEAYGTPWVWAITPHFFAITVDMGETLDRDGRWVCQVVCHFVPQTTTIPAPKTA